MRSLLTLLALSLLSAPALAHPGHADTGLLAGLLHPLSGIDHLLVMLGIGLWAGCSGGSARWQLPAAFVATMTLGWLAAAMFGVSLPLVESGIAASLMAVGLLIILRLQPPRALQIGLTALFAVFHGLAHGTELSAEAPLATAAGFIAATAALHAAGLGLTLVPRAERLFRIAGAGLVAVGAGLLLQ